MYNQKNITFILSIFNSAPTKQMCLCFIVTQCNVDEKIPKYSVNLLKICLSVTPSLNYAFNFFSLAKLLKSFTTFLSFIFFPFPIFPVPALFSSPFRLLRFCLPVLCSITPLSFIHDILITKSVINTLPDLYFPSIMADRCRLMWHKKVDKLLSTNSGAASARESNSEADWSRIPWWHYRFQRIIKQLVLFVTVTTRLSSINC